MIVHCVHGTFPRGQLRQLQRNVLYVLRRRRRPVESDLVAPPAPDPDRRYWFEEDSRFIRALRAELAEDAARVTFDRFLWSGNNSFAARETAAAALWEHLRQAHARDPDARHLVLAHSHGGTVAVSAIDANVHPEPVVKGLLSLATPYIRLRLRHQGEAPSWFSALVGATLPVMTLMLAPLTALLLVLWAPATEHVVLDIGRIALLLLSLLAIAARHVPLAAAIVLLGCGAGGDAVRSNVLVGALAAFFLTLGLYMKTRWLGDPSSPRWVQRQPIRLPCPLLAIRSPNDEASLTIGLGQLIERFFGLAGRLIGSTARWLGRPLARPGAERDPVRRTLYRAVALGYVLLATVLTVLLHDRIYGIERQSWWELVLVLPTPGLLLWALGSFLMLTWLVPGLALSVVAGAEALAAPMLTGIDAEPLPYAVPERCMKLVIHVEEPGSRPAPALNHSVYDVAAVRARVALWIRVHVRARSTVASTEGPARR